MHTISLAMIIKDEEAVLKRCLESVYRCVDEIIIVDTGSQDHSIEIAKQYTDSIYHFTWQDDFAAARNEAFSHATMDYILWLDADDLLPDKEQEKLLALKQTLSNDVDIVMMKYHIAFDQDDNPLFTYYRERLIRNHKQYRWEGKIHETIALQGNIQYADIAVWHKKLKPHEPDRNLRILQGLYQEGTLSTREQYYYARELYEHKQYQKAIQQFNAFLKQADGWKENYIDACRLRGHCYLALQKKQNALRSFYESFLYDLPRPEVLCDIGWFYMQENNYSFAIYWYHAALHIPKREESGGFIQHDCYNFIPYVQLSVCYDKLHNHKQALSYHQKAFALKPNHPIVKQNDLYFRSLNEEQ